MYVLYPTSHMKSIVILNYCEVSVGRVKKFSARFLEGIYVYALFVFSVY